MNLNEIQAYLVEHELDGWLMADFHGRNNVAVTMLNLTGLLTRRNFCFIPAHGDPVLLVNAIEKDNFTHLPGILIPYVGYHMFEDELKRILSGCRKIAMEYSPYGRLPYIGIVHAGTIEMVRRFVPEIVSSADLVANFQARLSVEQIASHRIAARNLIELKDKIIDFVRTSLSEGKAITEYDVALYSMNQLEKYDMETDDFHMTSVEGNAGKPHYSLTKESALPIKYNQILLMDIYARHKHANAVYADITWMAFIGKKEAIPSHYHEKFSIIAAARDKAVAFIRDNIEKRPVYGYEVDDVCRDVVKQAGFDKFFTHRTGHSITRLGHGPGPNIDNLETEDRRRLQKGHLFSIEPGIYMSDCGFRTEINCLITPEGCEITTLPLQNEIIPIF